MKIYLVTFFCFFISINLSAQNFEWAKSMGDVGVDVGRSIAIDANGNTYTTGIFIGTVDFDPGNSVFNITSVGIHDFFIQKLDPNGNLLWAKGIGSSGSDSGNGIGVDSSGNVYITGSFDGVTDFDPGAGVFNLTNTGSSPDIFVQKLDPNGNLLWAKSMGGTGMDIGESLSVDASGNVHITGSFRNIVDFDPGTSTFNLSATGANSDVFIQKLDPNGNFIWAKSMGSNYYDVGNAITTDLNGNVYTTGSFQGTVDFNPGAGTFNLTFSGSVGFNDAFIQKLDANGNFLWAKKIGGTDTDVGLAIAIDPNGVYTTGHFSKTVDFDPGSATFNLTATGLNSDIFIQKLDTNGNFVWAKRAGGTSPDIGAAIAIDDNGNVYTAGHFSNTVDFDPGAAIFNLSAVGNTDVFIQILDENGNFISAKSVGGTASDGATGIGLGNNKAIYTTGYFLNTVDFNPYAGVFNLTSNGNQDIFVHKVNQCIPTTGIDVQFGCSSYTWINGITYTSSNNTATDTLTTAAGCDSIVTLDLTISGADSLPYQEDFSGVFPPTATTVLNPDNANTWTGGILTASNGTTNDVMYIEYSAYNAAGQKDYFALPLLDLNAVTIAELSFDVSYNPYSETFSDTLAIEISTDCGLTYQPIYTKGGLDLSIDNAYTTTTWVPSNLADWRKDRIDLNSYIGNDVLIRFVGINGYGNNLYVDNINIGLPVFNNTAELEQKETLLIYPTPTKDYLNIDLVENLQEVQIQLFDMNGKVVLSQQYQEATQIELPVNSLSTGVYFVRIESNKGIQMAKMIKE